MAKKHTPAKGVSNEKSTGKKPVAKPVPGRKSTQKKPVAKPAPDKKQTKPVKRRVGRKPQKLNDKQIRFVQEYLVDQNATQAAIRAGYAEKSAACNGTRFLTMPAVQTLLKQEQARIAQKYEIEREWIIERLVRVIETDITEVVRIDHTGIHLRDAEEIPKPVRKLIQKVSQSLQGGIRVEMPSKLDAIEKLNRMFGFYVDRVEHSGPGGGPIVTQQQGPDLPPKETQAQWLERKRREREREMEPAGGTAT